nr:hypothetical protein [Micromonospora sp. 4G51]
MIERGSGRTSGLTDWRLMDVLSMWACLQDHDTAGHWKQVAGWRKVCDLALTHLSRLREYRRALGAAWPPETNAAARAYIGELDQLIDKAQRTHDAAAANYDALAAATRAIGSTRAELEPLYQAYATKLQQKRAYEATIADPKAVAGSRLPDQPPVTDADLERLNVQARGLMTGLSGELQQAQVMLRTPPAPPRRPGIQPNDPDVYGSNPPTPFIPTIVPIPIASSGTAHPSSRTSSSDRRVATPTAQRVGPAAGAGPVLGAAAPGLAPPPLSAGLSGMTAPVPPTSGSPASGLGLPPALPPVSAAPGRVGAPNPVDGRSSSVGKPVGGATGLPHTTPPRPLPPGGLIGGTPGMGLGQPGRAAVPPRRVNPIGGVIGGGGAGTAPTGAAGSRPGAGRGLLGAHGAPPIGGAPSMGGAHYGTSTAPGRPGHREQIDGQPRRWDPDDPWETDEGVSPVVQPPDGEGPIDPGPAIGFGR